jgi:HSP20 family protein
MTDKERKELEVSQKQEIDTRDGEPTRAGTWYVPQVDITQNDEAIVLYADLPGVKPEYLDIDVRDDVLTLTAEVEPLPTNRKLVWREYEVGGYQRKFTLGARIDQTKIEAALVDGVLTLTLPKAEEHKPRKITISS